MLNPSRRYRDVLLGWLFLTVALGAWTDAIAQTPTLYVYFNPTQKPPAVHRYLKKELTGFDVAVFGRVTDFFRQVSVRPPDAILSLASIIQQLEYSVDLQGYRDGEPLENYLLVSIEEFSGQQTLNDARIGVVDLLGRKKMSGFIKNIFKMGAPQQLRRVSKTEDLLRLLQYEVVDIIVLPEHSLSVFAAWTSMPLLTKKVEGATVGLPALSILNKKFREKIISSFLSQSEKVHLILRVDSWRKVQ